MDEMDEIYEAKCRRIICGRSTDPGSQIWDLVRAKN